MIHILQILFSLFSAGIIYEILKFTTIKFNHKQKGKLKMRQYVPVEPSVQAAEIMALAIVTTATLDDGTTAIVANDTVIGAFAIQQDDGSLKIVDKADFELHYKAA